MLTWYIALLVFLVGGLFGWGGGYCYGWLVGTEETERRWADWVDELSKTANCE